MVIVTRENGIDIHCDESGKFSAVAYGQQYEDRSLAKVKKWIASIKPTVTLLEVNPESPHYGGTRGFRLHEDIAAVALDGKGRVYGQPPTAPDNRQYRYETMYRNLYEPDEAAQAQIKALNAQREEWDRAVQTRYDAAFAEIVATLKPITPERFVEMLTAKGAAGKSDG